MSLRVWALKPGELKPLSRAGLVLLAARCALRVEPCFFVWWVDAPAKARSAWSDGLDTHVGDEPGRGL